MKSEDDNQSAEFRNKISTVTKTGKRRWIFAEKPSGKFYRLRNIFSWFYFIVFFTLPFIKVNGEPLMMLNFPKGKFVVLGKIFWPQDFFIFAVAMISAIIFIALFTAVWGRLFCGWVCPQTVFLEMLFRKVEWLIEGTYTQQQKRDAGPWTTDRVVRKTIKHIVFLFLSFWISHTFLAYIIGVDDLWKIIREPVSDHLILLFGLVFFSLLFYSVFAFAREIVCTALCPYGRLQAVLLDKDTMKIAYDYVRGEPRGKAKSGTTVGDCIDCNKCVHVCPMGIDIRNGDQIECTGCTACIDACDNVMLKINRETGLIRYASENQIRHRKPFKVTTRIKAYSAVLLLLLTLITTLILKSHSVDTHISRVKGQLYQELPGDSLSNLYNAEVLNKTREDVPLSFRVENLHAEVKMISSKATVASKEKVNLITFFIVLHKNQIHSRTTKLKIGVYQGDRKIQTVKTTFLGPFM
ncbi:cytochrome c oxidase accessory protein CcoG [Rurimicrobium arvi]|uniref:Cytochrome c oxidase accessory protein CcoG n=1 Tax=Rurimicrobium arvi TaxID=2049916 RepID=A0ABP8MMA0_9BACT